MMQVAPHCWCAVHREGIACSFVFVCFSAHFSAFNRDDLIDTLMSHGADPTVRDSLDQCAYDIAKFHHCDALVKRFGKESPSDRFAKKKEEATP